MSLYKLVSDVFGIPTKPSDNVPAVYDIFLHPIRKNAKLFYGRKKMWLRKNAQRAQARLRFFVVRAAEGGEAYTGLLGEGNAIAIIFLFIIMSLNTHCCFPKIKCYFCFSFSLTIPFNFCFIILLINFIYYRYYVFNFNFFFKF